MAIISRSKRDMFINQREKSSYGVNETDVVIERGEEDESKSSSLSLSLSLLLMRNTQIDSLLLLLLLLLLLSYRFKE